MALTGPSETDANSDFDSMEHGATPAGDRTRAALLVNHPAQYFAPAFRALAREPEIETRLFFWSAPRSGFFDPGFNRHVEWKTDLFSGYQWSAPVESAGILTKLWLSLRAIRTYRPEVVLCFGWASPVALIGILYCLIGRIPLVLYGDSNGRQGGRGLKYRVRALILTWLFARSAGFLSTGVANSALYAAYGVPAVKVHPGVLPIALDSFVEAAAGAQQRKEGETGRPFIIGFAGKLVDYKGPQELLRAVSDIQGGRQWEVWLVGDGPMRVELECMAVELGLQERVRFLGFKNTDELPRVLADMDVFVMPSLREPRGLVVIEAMAAGAVPVVSSATGVWGEGDAVQHGITGLVYPVGDRSSLTEQLQALLNDPEMVGRLSKDASECAKLFGPSQFASSARKALVATRLSRRGGSN